MNIQQSYVIEKIQASDQEQIISFMMKVRNEIFPSFSLDELPMDLLHLEESYLKFKNTAIYAVYSSEREVVGTIGIQAYDNRFPALESDYAHRKTAEIVKCYIDPNKRRQGIGTALFNQAEQFCKSVGYEVLYLHTHSFLPGAREFWKAKGFQERLAEDDPIWQTIHMDLNL